MDLKHGRVLVTPTTFGKHDPRLKSELENAVGEVIYNPYSRPLTSDDLRDLLAGVDGFIAGLDTIDRAALATADRLQVIARYGVGVEKVDLEAAREKEIVVTNTPGANAGAVAELAVGLMLALARQIPQAAEQTRAGGWPRMSGISIEGKCVGLLGLGAVGKEVTRRLHGFGCAVLAYDPYVEAGAAEALGVRLAALDDVVMQADFLSLHQPVTPETRGMVDAAFLAKMKRGSYLINTSRGELIDDSALVAALKSGQLAGAALDCFAPEPPTGSPILELGNVILTPHMGAHTDGATNAMGWAALRDCLAVLRGDEPRYRVT